MVFEYFRAKKMLFLFVETAYAMPLARIVSSLRFGIRLKLIMKLNLRFRRIFTL